MRINTRDFGEIDVDEAAIYHFSQPIFGFEEYTDYVALQDDEVGESLLWLQSAQNAQLCFILLDPSGIAEFQPVLPAGSDKLLGEEDCFCWVITCVGVNAKDSTVNLKSPVFLNPVTHRAAQIMLESDYPVRYPIMKAGA